MVVVLSQGLAMTQKRAARGSRAPHSGYVFVGDLFTVQRLRRGSHPDRRRFCQLKRLNTRAAVLKTFLDAVEV